MTTTFTAIPIKITTSARRFLADFIGLSVGSLLGMMPEVYPVPVGRSSGLHRLKVAVS